MGSVMQKLGLISKGRIKNRRERRDEKWERGFKQRKIQTEKEFKAKKRQQSNVERMLRKGREANERANERVNKRKFEATLKTY